MRFLRYNTSCIVPLGPFLSTANGVTLKTSGDFTLTSTKVSLIYQTSNNSAPTVALDNVTCATNSTNALNWVTGADDATLQLSLTGTDTSYLGHGRITVLDGTQHCPVWEDVTVLPQQVYDSMIQGSDLLDTNVSQIAGSNVSTGAAQIGVNLVNIAGTNVSTSTAQLGVNVVNVAGSATTATLDSLSSQIGNIATTGAAAYQAAASFTATVAGTPTGTYANTDTSNGVYHQVPDSGGALDVYYEYTLRPDEVAVGVQFKGRMTGAGDNVACQAYDWVGDAWVTLFTVTGVGTSTDTTQTPSLVGKYTGTTGAELGLVRIRFYAASGLTSANLYVDQLIVAKASTSRTVGYSNGSIWVKATGTSGTVQYVNGTADNPCPWADALTLSAALGISRFTIVPGTSITLAAALAGAVVTGRSYTLALGGQNISASYFEGVEGLSGTGTCATGEAIIVDSHLGAITIGEADFVRCHLMAGITMSQNSVPYRFHDCTGITGAKITFTGDAQSAVISKMSGAMTIAGMQTGNTLYVDGNGDLTLDATNTGGTVYVTGGIKLTNAGSGQTIYYSDVQTAAQAAARRSL